MAFMTGSIFASRSCASAGDWRRPHLKGIETPVSRRGSTLFPEVPIVFANNGPSCKLETKAHRSFPPPRWNELLREAKHTHRIRQVCTESDMYPPIGLVVSLQRSDRHHSIDHRGQGRHATRRSGREDLSICKGLISLDMHHM